MLRSVARDGSTLPYTQAPFVCWKCISNTRAALVTSIQLARFKSGESIAARRIRLATKLEAAQKTLKASKRHSSEAKPKELASLKNTITHLQKILSNLELGLGPEPSQLVQSASNSENDISHGPEIAQSSKAPQAAQHTSNPSRQRSKKPPRKGSSDLLEDKSKQWGIGQVPEDSDALKDLPEAVAAKVKTNTNATAKLKADSSLSNLSNVSMTRKTIGRRRIRRVTTLKGRHWRTETKVAPKAGTSEAKRKKRVDSWNEPGSTIGDALGSRSLSEAMNDSSDESTTSKTFIAGDLELEAIDHKTGPVPKLAHGLHRALFNRGVVQFRDLHSRVYNFDPSLELLPPVDKVDFKTLTNFTPPSKDETLRKIANDRDKKYIGSTSSMTGILKHMHFLLSAFRGLNFMGLSHFNQNPWKFTKLTHGPDAVILRYEDGVYAVDSDKQFDSANVLSMMGRYLEKYFTSDKTTFERYRAGNKDHSGSEEEEPAEAFHYSSLDDFLLRSQLDAHDSRLPGSGIFDLKTRAVLPIRMDSEDFEPGMDYEIQTLQGQVSSYEREFADMCRSTMLKYSLQARIGRMDGIFVAYHNIARIFGFQYISLNEMDLVMHGQEDRTLGDQEFLASVRLLNELFNRATERFPEQSLRIHVETPEARGEPKLNFYAEPVTSEEIDEIQNANKARIAAWEKEMLGLQEDGSPMSAPSESDRESESIFSNLGSNTARFRARARKLHETRLQRRALAEAEFATDWLESLTPEQSAAKTAEGEKEAAEMSAAETSDATPAETGTAEAAPAKTKTTIAPDLTTSEPLLVEDELAASEETTAPEPISPPQDTSSKPEQEGTLKPLIALSLTVKNKVNGRHCKSPEKFSAGQEWQIEYTIREVGEQLARFSYQATKRKRRSLFDHDARDARTGWFWDNLKHVARAGKGWRDERDGIDREKEVGDKGVWVWDREVPVQRGDYMPFGEENQRVGTAVTASQKEEGKLGGTG